MFRARVNQVKQTNLQQKNGEFTEDHTRSRRFADGGETSSSKRHSANYASPKLFPQTTYHQLGPFYLEHKKTRTHILIKKKRCPNILVMNFYAFLL